MKLLSTFKNFLAICHTFHFGIDSENNNVATFIVNPKDIDFQILLDYQTEKLTKETVKFKFYKFPTFYN
jgi:hypothetical protein